MHGRLIALVLLTALLAAPTGHAALNRPLPVSIPVPFMDGGAQDGGLVLVAGRLEATTPSTAGTHGFWGTHGLALSADGGVCWEDQCRQGEYALVVRSGGDVALRLPGPTIVEVAAAHAIGLFIDWRAERDLAAMGLGASLTASLVDGTATVTALGRLDPADPAVLAVLGEDTTIEVWWAGAIAALVATPDQRVSFHGTAPLVAPFEAESVVLPFGPTAVASFTPARPADVQHDLHQQRIDDAVGEHVDDVDLPAAAQVLLRSVALHVPAGGREAADLLESGALLRFTALDVRGAPSGVRWEGWAPVQVLEGEVQGARPLVWIFPWWAFLLWAVALGALVARIVAKPPKRHARWDRLRWIGLAGGIVAFVALFLLWDHEVHALWGVSLLRGGAGAVGTMAFLQLLPLLLVVATLDLPLRSLLGNAARLSQQGTFMGLAHVLSPLLAYLLGAKLLLDYLGKLLAEAASRLGG